MFVTYPLERATHPPDISSRTCDFEGGCLASAMIVLCFSPHRCGNDSQTTALVLRERQLQSRRSLEAHCSPTATDPTVNPGAHAHTQNYMGICCVHPFEHNLSPARFARRVQRYAISSFHDDKTTRCRTQADDIQSNIG